MFEEMPLQFYFSYFRRLFFFQIIKLAFTTPDIFQSSSHKYLGALWGLREPMGASGWLASQDTKEGTPILSNPYFLCTIIYQEIISNNGWNCQKLAYIILQGSNILYSCLHQRLKKLKVLVHWPICFSKTLVDSIKIKPALYDIYYWERGPPLCNFWGTTYKASSSITLVGLFCFRNFMYLQNQSRILDQKPKICSLATQALSEFKNNSEMFYSDKSNWEITITP